MRWAKSARLGRRAQVLLQEGEGAAPGDVGLLLIVADLAGVVVEGVLRARIGIGRELLVVLFQRFFKGSRGAVHALVFLGIVLKQRSLDVGNFVHRGRAAI